MPIHKIPASTFAVNTKRPHCRTAATALIAINNPLLTFPGHFSSTIKQPSHSAMPVYSRGISLLSSIFSPYQTSVLLIWSASTFMNSFFLDLLTGTLY